MEALNGTFHPEVEDRFKSSLPWPEFKQVQWKRIHLAIHYCNQISNNAGIFLGWMRHEREQGVEWMNSGTRKSIEELQMACTQSLLAAFFVRARLRLWLIRMVLLPFAPPPSFITLAQKGSADMIAFYENMQTMAEIFSLAYGADYHQKLMQAL